MAMNLASKYAKKVDERFSLKSLTDAAVNKDYDWSGVKTVTVYGVETAAMNDYARTGSGRYGTANELGNTKQDLTLSRDRSFTFTIDRGNMDETMGVMQSGKALARETDEVVVPEIDTYRLRTMGIGAAAAASTGIAAVSTTTAYAKFLAGCEALNDNKVPVANRIAFVTPAFYSLIKQDATFVKASEMGQEMLINGQVGKIDNVRIIMVPSSYLPNGASFIICHPSATVSPKKLEDYKIHDNPPGINGWLVEGRLIYDAFVLNNKNKALFIHFSTCTALTIASVEGTAQGDSKITATIPENLSGLGKLMYKAGAAQTAPALGDAIASGGGWADFTSAHDYTLTTGQYIAVAVVVDGKCVASGRVVIASKA